MDEHATTTTCVAAPLMSPGDVAAFLGLPLATLRKWRVNGTGPRAYRIGKHLRYRREDLETWLALRADAP